MYDVWCVCECLYVRARVFPCHGICAFKMSGAQRRHTVYEWEEVYRQTHMHKSHEYAGVAFDRLQQPPKTKSGAWVSPSGNAQCVYVRYTLMSSCTILFLSSSLSLSLYFRKSILCAKLQRQRFVQQMLAVYAIVYNCLCTLRVVTPIYLCIYFRLVWHLHETRYIRVCEQICLACSYMRLYGRHPSHYMLSSAIACRHAMHSSECDF